MGILQLENQINTILSRGEKLFIPYVMCGDGGLAKTEKLLTILEETNASIIELGIPFSDPIADGSVIQAAGQRALNDGITLKDILTFLKERKPKKKVPTIIMSYLNPIIQYGMTNFFEAMKEAEISGVIIPDLPLEEYQMIADDAGANDIAIIPLIAPSTSLERMKTILHKANGFIYTVTVNGTTGTRRIFEPSILQRLSEIKASTSMAVVAGFGVSTKEHIELLSHHCDGVVMGSKIVDLAYKNDFEAIRTIMDISK